jgi:bifunctional enzyme CysN/CysC
LAIILVDARNGVSIQTKRHSFITSLLGIKHVIVAVNKMDLVDYSQQAFEEIRDDYTKFAARMTADDVHFIPMSALKGDNIVHLSENMPWYEGGTLMHMLETVHIASDRNLIDFRFPVQLVNRPHLDFRGYCGTVASGVVRVGDDVIVLPSRKKSRIKSIVSFEGEQPEAFAPLATTLTLEDEIDVSRGDTIVSAGNVPRVAQKFDAMVVWMDEDPMVPGKQYLMKQTNKTSPGQISTLRYRMDINTLHRQEAPTLSLNEIGRCEVSTNEPFIFDPYHKNRGMGSFIVIDRLSNRTVAAGMILDHSSGQDRRALWDAEPTTGTLHAQIGNVSADERENRFGQKGCTILITGLSGSGKSTTAYGLERKLFSEGRAVAVLDGQNMRQGISKDLGFTAPERSENLRRSVEVAKLMNDAGLITVAAFAAPEAVVRKKAAKVVGADRFLVVYLSAPVEVCRERDQEGLYDAADRGEIANFPGVSAPYDEPTDADMVLATDKLTVAEVIDQIVGLLKERKFI